MQDQKAETRKIHLTAAAVTALDALREAIRLHDGGMVCEVTPGDGDQPKITLTPVDEASDSAVIGYAATAALCAVDPQIGEARARADEARRRYIEELQNAWKGE